MRREGASKAIFLLIAAMLVSISGLVYELLEGTVSSYLLGDSVYQFSIVIGVFMSSMGIGAWLSRYITHKLVEAFIDIQLLTALFGGFSTAILFYAFAVVENYSIFLYLETIVIGGLIGMEIPLIVRILEERFTLGTNISNVLSADYAGALVASILFPLFFLPTLGIMQTALFFGSLNALVALLSYKILLPSAERKRLYKIAAVFALLGTGWLYAGEYESYIRHRLYSDSVIYSETTPYQQLTLTKDGKRIRLYINGALQFDSLDEYRYHESLVHPPMSCLVHREKVLVIGGGDGLALRELLKYPELKDITLVDLDPAMTRLFAKNPLLRSLNNNSFSDPRVEVKNEDAWKFIESSSELYDLIIVDLPDPDNISLSRLYSIKFYTMLSAHLRKGGVMNIQATSPLFTRKAYWSIVHTLRAVGLYTLPYHCYIPSFGEWGFVSASRTPLHPERNSMAPGRKFVEEGWYEKLAKFPPDMNDTDALPNSIFRHPLLKYYEEGWERWYG
jgi:spermidine synthase